ncbi:MAG: serine--tRNA ligase [Alphaproteobacteria bacterium]|nr:serine--tRNA ligase [Alphaproteobacteria bacterium]
MHDIKRIREETANFVRGLERRGIRDARRQTDEILSCDGMLRDLQSRLQQLQARRNDASKQIGAARARKEEDKVRDLMAEVAGLKDEIQKGEEAERRGKAELSQLLLRLPNLPASDVPHGDDERSNVEIAARAFGRPPGMNSPKDHVALGEALGMMDFTKAGEVSGARFVYLLDSLAKLERALAGFMLDIHTREFGYREVAPPLLVRDAAMVGTGQLPKFEGDLFRAATIDETLQNRLWLVPTAEVPLTNYVRGELLDEGELPIRLTAATPCFRSEAGAAGKDTHGMIRMHQFSKVELVSITVQEESGAELERMTDCAQEVLRRLGLHHRVMALCTGDLGFQSSKTYDIEVWMPAQNRFREISSCSTCGDFQARRMDARYRGKQQKQTRHVHTLNGSALAIGRTIVAIMENFQEPDGSIAVPEALRPYLGGLEKIVKPPVAASHV